MAGSEDHLRLPHMVMAVGNHVVGDSRVEKAAITARDHGYRVTVLGVKHRSVPALGFIDGNIPVLRLSLKNAHHHGGTSASVRKVNAAAGPEAGSRLDGRLDCLAARSRAVVSRVRAGERSGYTRIRDALAVGMGIGGKLIENGLSTIGNSRRRAADLMLRVHALPPEGWRALWPQISDYEELFLSGFKFLQPDLIHVHDRHPMAGAVAYTRQRREQGDRVDWIYDAHEWLPGQWFPGPRSARVGWLEAERDLVRDARTVVTVSDQLAEQLARRHSLPEVPTVVGNAPMSSRTPRRRAVGSLRADAGLPAGEAVAVYVGAITERRGVLDLVDACALSSKPFHVVFLAPADPRSRASIRERALEKGVSERVHVLDYVDADAVVPYIASADAGVSPLRSTPAHHLAIPTKVREYIQARLPVVVSDMRAQEELVRATGIGEVVQAGDAADLVRAIEAVLGSPDDYRGRITDELLREHCWESAAPRLTAVWEALARPAAAARRKNSTAEVAVTSAKTKIFREYFLQGPSSIAARFAETALRPIPVEYFSQVSVDPSDQGARTVWERWCHEYGGLKARVSDELEPNEFDDKELTGLLRRTGITTVRFVGERAADDVELLLDSYPEHWLHDLDPERLARRVRTSRRVRGRLIAAGNTVLSPVEQLVAAFEQKAVFIPIPLEFTGRLDVDQVRRKKPRIGVLPVARSGAERHALSELRSLEREAHVDSLEVVDQQSLSKYDIVIDAMSEDTPTVEGLTALAAGAVVVVGQRTEASRLLTSEKPVVHAGPGELVETVDSLLRDASGREHLRARAAEYLRRRHSVQAALAALDAALR